MKVNWKEQGITERAENCRGTFDRYVKIKGGELKISQFEERKSNLLSSSVHHNLNLFVYFQL